MIVNISATPLAGIACECGEPASPGLFSVQVIGDGTQRVSMSAAEPMALCEPCGELSGQPSEHAFGVLVIRLV